MEVSVAHTENRKPLFIVYKWPGISETYVLSGEELYDRAHSTLLSLHDSYREQANKASDETKLPINPYIAQVLWEYFQLRRVDIIKAIKLMENEKLQYNIQLSLSNCENSTNRLIFDVIEYRFRHSIISIYNSAKQQHESGNNRLLETLTHFGVNQEEVQFMAFRNDNEV